MFDPTIGRWLMQDPEGFKADDPNLYRYVKNDPVNETDPSGMAPPGLVVPVDPNNPIDKKYNGDILDYWKMVRKYDYQQVGPQTLPVSFPVFDTYSGGYKIDIKDGPQGIVKVFFIQDDDIKKQWINLTPEKYITDPNRKNTIFNSAGVIKIVYLGTQSEKLSFVQLFHDQVKYQIRLLNGQLRTRYWQTSYVGSTTPPGFKNETWDGESGQYYVDAFPNSKEPVAGDFHWSKGVSTSDSPTTAYSLLAKFFDPFTGVFPYDKVIDGKTNLVDVTAVKVFDVYLMYQGKSIYHVTWTDGASYDVATKSFSNPPYIISDLNPNQQISSATYKNQIMKWFPNQTAVADPAVPQK